MSIVDDVMDVETDPLHVVFDLLFVWADLVDWLFDLDLQSFD
jgi:hypothetical protein